MLVTLASILFLFLQIHFSNGLQTLKLKHMTPTNSTSGVSVGYTDKPPTGPPMLYRGGSMLAVKNTPVIKVNMYMYGSKFSMTNNAQHSLLSYFNNNVGASSWFSSTNSYVLPFSTGKNKVTTGPMQITSGSIYADLKYSAGTNIKRTTMIELVQKAINTKKFGAGSGSDIYAFIFDSSVSFSGFCTDWCGWHDFYLNNNNNPIYIMVIGSPARCPEVCNVLKKDNSNSPNGNYEMDAIINVLAHEISEVITDPIFKTFFDDNGDENADKCAWRYGKVQSDKGKLWNYKVGAKNFLIQQNWDYKKMSCV